MDDHVGGLLLVGVAALVCYGSLAQGAFFPDQASFFGAVVAVLAFVASARAHWVHRWERRAIAVLALGLVASIVANGWAAESRHAILTLAAAASAIPLVRALLARGELRRYLEVLTAVGAAVSLIGLVSVAFHFYPWATQAHGIWRLSSTLTYVNAAACFLVLTLPAAVMVIRARPSAGAHIGYSLMLAALIVTLSRGAAIASVVALAVMMIAGGRRSFDGLLRPTIAGLVIAGAIMPSVTSLAGRPSIAIAGLIIGAIIAVPRRSKAPRSRIAALVFAAAVMLIPILFVGQGTGRVIDARIAVASEDRLRTWNASLDQGLDRPIFGTGPGTFHLVERVGAEAEQTRFAHNEYLQVFAETGGVGLAALLAAIGMFSVGVMRARPPLQRDRRSRRAARARWAIAVAPCAAFAVHGFFDFVWHLPALVFIAFGWLGLAATHLPEEEHLDETT